MEQVRRMLDSVDKAFSSQAKPDCVKKNLCNGAGRCLADSCEADGFKCKCSDNHYGKYCQYEKFYDYDINFPNTTANNFIDLGTIEMDFKEFTFTAWIKFNPGFTKYPLVSYIAKNTTEMFALAFRSDDTSGTTIGAFSGNLLGQHVDTNTIPIDDGYWHHVGFAWSGVTGEWILLIDGVLWATRNVSTVGKISSGGVLTIGKIIDNGVVYHLVGNVSLVNLWSTAKTGGEIEEIAKRPGSRDGHLITWFMVKDLISDLRIIRPSTAAFSGNGTNYEINLPLANVNYPGPYKTTRFLSSCLWFYGSNVDGNTTFFVYDTVNIFGISSVDMVSTINGFSSKRNTVKGFRQWHFLCIQWNGIAGTVTYFYDGYAVDGKIQNETLKTQLPPGKNFSIGLGEDGIGKLTQLNIWDYEIAASSVIAMSSGGFNVHGSVMSWRSLAKYVPSESIMNYWNSSIYLPGFTVLAKRTKWCNDKYPSTNDTLCPGRLLARLGGHIAREKLEWRCFCPEALYDAKYTYNFSTLSPSYYSKYSAQIGAMN
ncbi:Sushi, von Willebrand factor type A, EGF and pentraxin domain-containing 1 [Paramuricea clavata]|uniref:Sushi, von Willebrand factor type A, EGF and pentraxin domain-containing 1 n=1 Tax=Paramuricea clavata TaxID=317549 RepID=A0A7D9HUN2_PARCT|nr:Sushi, von Willebrand factor type A, EGF and pentraxin domain-containing 1 [Paramuricea clavata]